MWGWSCRRDAGQPGPIGEAVPRGAELPPGSGGVPVPGGPNFAADMAGEKGKYLHSKLAAGSRSAYGSGWRHWQLFCKACKRDPWLLGWTEVEVRADAGQPGDGQHDGAQCLRAVSSVARHAPAQLQGQDGRRNLHTENKVFHARWSA